MKDWFREKSENNLSWPTLWTISACHSRYATTLASFVIALVKKIDDLLALISLCSKCVKKTNYLIRWTSFWIAITRDTFTVGFIESIITSLTLWTCITWTTLTTKLASRVNWTGLIQEIKVLYMEEESEVNLVPQQGFSPMWDTDKACKFLLMKDFHKIQRHKVHILDQLYFHDSSETLQRLFITFNA